MGVNKILVISDLHVGSLYSVMPQKFENVLANKVQLKIYRMWREMCENVKDIDLLIVDGDVVDGTQKQNSGKEVWTSDVEKQIKAASELVGMIDYEKAMVAYGSFYHTDENLNADQVFANKINAAAHGWELSIKPRKGDETIHVSHQISVSSSAWQYRTTPLAKELMFALLNEKELYKYKCIIRAHAHYFCSVAFSSQFAWVNPCWQTRTPYMVRKGLALIPKLGYVVLHTPEGGEWRIEAKTFNIPRLETAGV